MPKVRMPDGTFVEFGADALFNDDDTPFTTLTPGVPPNGRTFSEADVARIRQEEKDKLYSKIEDNSTELTMLREQVGTLTAAQEAERQRLEAEQASLQEAARLKEEENLSAKDLITRARDEWNQKVNDLNTTWEQKLEEERKQREASEALLNREREFSTLREYTQAQVAANQDNIAPQLLPYIQGNTQEEIDASIARAVDTTNQITADLVSAQEQFTQQQQPTPWGQVAPETPVQVPLPGTRPTGGPGNTDPASQYQTLTAEQIKSMPMDQYAALRGKMGIAGRNSNQGMFG